MKPSREEMHASVRRAIACPDESWYRGLLAQDATGCSLSAEEVASILSGTIEAAVEVACETALKYPGLSPLALANALGLDVVRMGDHAGMGPVPLLGLYQPAERQIMVRDETMATIAEFIATYELGQFTPATDLRTCVLYHEIFHAIEDAMPHIFTRSDMLQRKLFGLVSLRRGLAIASEIGAIHFSRLMAKTDYSPSIFGCYLLLAEGGADLSVFPD